MFDLLREKLNYFKFVTGFLAMIVGILAFHVLGGQVIQYYDLRQQVKENMADAHLLDDLKENAHARQMADIYGGSTPEETLKLYSAALERGDYLLAAKYFTQDRRDAVLLELQHARKAEIRHMAAVLKTLRRTNDPDAINSTTTARMSVTADGSDFAMDFLLYPSGVWKIVEGS